jgi:murein DD-endopeptidase MepM/ murein hydrolase activator NlpD
MKYDKFSLPKIIKFTSMRSFLLFFLITLLWLFLETTLNPVGFASNGGFVDGKTASMASEESLLPIIAAPIEKCAGLFSYVVKKGDTFLKMLSQFGLSNDKVIQCCRSLTSLGLFALIPGDSLVVKRHPDSGVTGFSLLHKLNWYTVAIDSIGIKADKKTATLTSQRCIAKGELLTSLSESMNDIGLDDVCVTKFADIFAWDINFFVDPQVGDSFEFIFEKKFMEGRFAGFGDILTATYVNRGHAFKAIGLKDENGILHYFTPEGKSLQKQFLKAPLRFNHISSGFSSHRMHPILGIVRPHLGIDYAAPVGTPVYASADGVVCSMGYNGGFGNLVKIRHGGAFETCYGHLRSFCRGMRGGKRVVQGECIGYVGQTGMATGPHLDYRMTCNNRFVNPSTVCVPAGKSVTPEQKTAFNALRVEYAMLFAVRLPSKDGAYVLDVTGAGPPSDSLGLRAPQITAYQETPN